MLIKLAKFLTSTSLLLALDGPIILVFGYLLYGVQINFEMLGASFCAVFAIYSLNKATDKAEDKINRPETATKSSAYYIVPAIAALALCFILGAMVSPFAVAILATPIIIGVLYSIQIVKSVPRFKEITGAKSLVVAFSWSLYGTFLPLALQSTEFEKVVLVFAYVFMQVFVNTVLFDYLDMKGDSAMGVKTLPIVLGKDGTKRLLIFANSALGLWLAFCVYGGIFMKFIPALTFGVGYGYAIIWHFLRQDQPRLRAELMIDGQWFPIVAFMKIIIR